MAVKKEDPKKSALSSIEELEKTVKIRAPKASPRTPAEKPAPRAPAQKTAAARVTIRLVRSGICAPLDQKQTLAGLGLRKLNHEVTRSDSHAVRGMIHKVRHLVEVRPAGE